LPCLGAILVQKVPLMGMKNMLGAPLEMSGIAPSLSARLRAT
jgi:hypothetical protein